MSMYAIMAVREYSQTSGAEYALMLVIADGVDSSVGLMRGRDVYELARMAHLCHYDSTEAQIRNARRRCQRMITSLLKRGELIVVTGGHRAKNRYIVPILPGEPAYAPEPCTDMTHDCNRYHTSLDVSREQEAIKLADGRMRREYNGRQFTPANLRGAAPEPPLAVSTENDVSGAAPEPPQGRPIDHPGAAPEPPQGRPIDRTLSHSNPIDNPKMIPEAPTHHKKKKGQKTPEPETPSSLPPSPSAAEEEGQDWRPGDIPASQVWAGVVAYLRRSATDSQMSSWILPTRISRYGWDADGVLRVELRTPGRGHADQIDQRYSYLIIDAIGRQFNLSPRQVCLSYDHAPLSQVTRQEVRA